MQNELQMDLPAIARQIQLRSEQEGITVNTRRCQAPRPLPSHYPEARWSEVSQRVREILQRTAKRGEWPLYLWGDTGTGKSCAAACAYASWHSSALWYGFSQVCDDLARFNTASTVVFRNGDVSIELSIAGYWHRIETTGLLVIDEIGTRESTHHRYDTMHGLLEARKGKPMIITGNLPIETVATVYDDRVASRLCAGTMVRIIGDDRRLKGVENRNH